MVQGAGVNTDPFLVTVMIGLSRLVFTFLAAYMSKTFGRRPTAIISGIGMTVSLLILATHILLLQEPPSLRVPSLSANDNITDLFNTTEAGEILEANNSISYLPLMMLLIYIISSTIGFLTLPWSMIGEVYPSQIRGVSFYILTIVDIILAANLFLSTFNISMSSMRVKF